MWTRFVLTGSTISGPWRSFDPRPSLHSSPRLRDKVWEGPGNEAGEVRHKRFVLLTFELKLCASHDLQPIRFIELGHMFDA